MAQKKKIELTRLQGIIAVASFTSGVLIAAVCLFPVVATSGIRTASEWESAISRTRYLRWIVE